MLSSDEMRISEEWKKYSGYTVRPLPSTCLYYRELIESYKNGNQFLMYGGTPEIRSIFQELNFPVTLVDRSELIIRSMGSLTALGVAVAKTEKFIEANWLDLSKLKSKYDLLIGDDAINMVAWDDFDSFISNAYNVLNDDGIFICHLLVKPDDDLINKTFNDIESEFKHGIIKSKYDLASRLNFTCFDRESYLMGWQRTINMIGSARLGLFRPHFNFVDVFGLCNSQFYCPPQDKFENMVSKYFLIEEIFYPHEHEYCMYEPVYVLRKINKGAM